MWTIGDRVVLREDVDDGRTGDVGMVIGRQGDRYVLRFGPGAYAVAEPRQLQGPRERSDRGEAIHRAR